MLQDNLIGAALRFRDTELWKRLRESQLFVVKLPDGEMVYCAVMGNKGEYLALGMYKGAEGLSSYFNSLRMSRESAIDIMLCLRKCCLTTSIVLLKMRRCCIFRNIRRRYRRMPRPTD